MSQLAGNFVVLDRMLAQYGPEAMNARAALRSVLDHQTQEEEQLLGANVYNNIKSGATVGESILEQICTLSPKDEDQRFFKQQSLNLEVQIQQ